MAPQPPIFQKEPQLKEIPSAYQQKASYSLIDHGGTLPWRRGIM